MTVQLPIPERVATSKQAARLLAMLDEAGLTVTFTISRLDGAPVMNAVEVFSAYETTCQAIDAAIREAGVRLDAEDVPGFEAAMEALILLVGEDDSEVVRLRTMAHFLFTPCADDDADTEITPPG